MLQKHQSRPLWARELKHQRWFQPYSRAVSRPLWARELKLHLHKVYELLESRAPCGRVN